MTVRPDWSASAGLERPPSAETLHSEPWKQSFQVATLTIWRASPQSLICHLRMGAGTLVGGCPLFRKNGQERHLALPMTITSMLVALAPSPPLHQCALTLHLQWTEMYYHSMSERALYLNCAQQMLKCLPFLTGVDMKEVKVSPFKVPCKGGMVVSTQTHRTFSPKCSIQCHVFLTLMWTSVWLSCSADENGRIHVEGCWTPC